MQSKQSYKQALIEVILNCPNNPYQESTLTTLRLIAIQMIHDELILSRGKPIEKMSEYDLQYYNEMQWH